MADKLQGFSVLLLWHDQPEGGAFGSYVAARSHSEAEDKVRLEMAQTLAEDNFNADDIDRAEYDSDAEYEAELDAEYASAVEEAMQAYGDEWVDAHSEAGVNIWAAADMKKALDDIGDIADAADAQARPLSRVEVAHIRQLVSAGLKRQALPEE